MKQFLFILLLLVSSANLFAQNVTGYDGAKEDYVIINTPTGARGLEAIIEYQAPGGGAWVNLGTTKMGARKTTVKLANGTIAVGGRVRIKTPFGVFYGDVVVKVICEPVEVNSFADSGSPIASSQSIRLTSGFTVPKGDFFRAYIDNNEDYCPDCSEDITGCCQLENSCVSSVSECWCYDQDGWVGFSEDNDGECSIGSGSGCGSDSGTCYRCDLVNGVNEVTLIGTLNQTQCEINAFYSWSSSDVSIGDPCPTICADLDPTSTVCCVINEGCQQMSEQACCEIGGHPETGGQCTVIANSTCGATLTGGNCYRCNGNLIEAIAPYNQTQCEADPNYNWSPVTVYIGHACPGSGSGSGTGSGCPGSFDSPATGCCNYPDPISGDDVCGPMSEWECCSYDGQFTPGDISQCDIGTNNCPNSGPKLSNTNIAVQIFPNPNNGTFTFKLDSPLEGILDMKIFDVTGRVVYEEASSYILSGEYQKEIQLPASLTDGMYNITVTVGEGQINKRIVIMR